MSVPQTPADFLALVPNPSEPQCDALRKVLLQLPQLIYLQQKYMYNEDGTLTTEFAQDICAALGLIDCSSGGGTTTTAGTGTTTASTTTAATAIVWAVTGPPSGVGTTPNRFLSLNLATGAVTVISTSSSYFYGLAEDPTDGTLYGLVLNGSDIDLVTVDKVTGAESVVAAAVAGFVNPPTGMAFKSDGTLWVEQGTPSTPCASNGTLKTMDKATGVQSSIGTHSSFFLSDICFVGSTLYAIGQQGCFSETKLMTVNQSTGAVTVVQNLDPVEGEPQPGNKLVYINSILYKTLINTILQVNTSTGDTTSVATFDNATQGRIRGLAYNG